VVNPGRKIANGTVATFCIAAGKWRPEDEQRHSLPATAAVRQRWAPQLVGQCHWWPRGRAGDEQRSKVNDALFPRRL